MNHQSDSPEPFVVSTPSGVVLRGEADGSGPPLVLLHGLTATRRYVLQGSRMLARRGGRTLVSYDARGHGESGAGASYAYDDLVEDLAAVLDSHGISSCVLVGSSMGAHTAAGFALRFPGLVTGVVAITPAYAGAPSSDPRVLAGWDARADALAAGDVDRFVELTGVEELPSQIRDTARTAVRQRAERHRDLAAVAAAVREVPRSAAFDGIDALGAIKVPALVVASRDEADPEHPLAVGEAWAASLPNGRLVTEEAGESPLAWRGAQLSRAIASFLESKGI